MDIAKSSGSQSQAITASASPGKSVYGDAIPGNKTPGSKMPGNALRAEEAAIAQQKVLRNTYLLLSATLLFSGFTATISAVLNVPHPGILVTLAGYFGLLFLTSKYRNSAAGIYWVFALTGFMGLTLGPIISAYWAMAPMIVMQAFVGTGVIFLGISSFAVSSKRDFSFLGPSLMIGIVVAFLAGIGALVFSMPALSLAVSAMFVILMSGLILFETNQIVRGGETNYVMATVTLFVSIFNLFTSLLHLLGFAQGE